MAKKGVLLEKIKRLSDQNQMLSIHNKKMIEAMKEGAIHVGMLKSHVAELDTEIEELKLKLADNKLVLNTEQPKPPRES